MRFRLSLVATLALFVAGVAASTASANHSWGNYHWARTSNPFTLQVGDNVTSAWDSYLDQAIADWNPSTVLDLRKVAGGTTARKCRATAGRIEVCNASYGNNGWLGIAQIWISGGSHITQGTTKLNDTYFNTAQYNTPAWRGLVTCQEIAHDFGLDHQDETFNNPNLGSCMDYTNDPDGGGFYGPSNVHPNKHDFDQIATIYSHLDSTTTIASATAGAGKSQYAPGHNDEDGEDHFERSDHISYTTFHRDFGNGRHKITHVFWALP